MNLRHQLMQNHTKVNMLSIREYVGTSPERFDELMQLFFTNEYRIQQRSSWAVSHCVDKHPELIGPYLKKMLELLDQPVHDAVKRNTLRIFRDIKIPEDLHGFLADKCFGFLVLPKCPAAIQVFSMYCLLKVVKKEPGLAREFRLLIDEIPRQNSKAFLSAAPKIRRQLDAIIRS